MVETLQEYKKIMVAIDESAHSEQAFKRAVHIAKINHATLLLCHVVDIRSFSTETFMVDSDVFMDPSLFEELRKSMEEKLKTYAQTARENGVEKVETLVEVGIPKEMLGEEIPKSAHVDLIICGQSGLSAVERFIMGSVSKFIVSHAPCDVMVVR